MVDALLLLLEGGAAGTLLRKETTDRVCAGFKLVPLSRLLLEALPTVTGTSIRTNTGLRDGGEIGGVVYVGRLGNNGCGCVVFVSYGTCVVSDGCMLSLIYGTLLYGRLGYVALLYGMGKPGGC